MIPTFAVNPGRPDAHYLPVRPYGLFLRVKSEKVETSEDLKKIEDVTVIDSDDLRYTGFVEGNTACGVWRESPVNFTLPKIDDKGFFRVGRTLYYVCEVGLANPWKPFHFGEYHYMDRKQVILRVLEHIFGTGYSSSGDGRRVSRSSPFATFFFSSTNRKAVAVNSVRLQTMLLSRLIAHPWVRQVQDSPIQKEGWEDTVILYPRPQGLQVDPYLYPESFRKRLDPTSTSVSETVNRVYHLCDGARIRDGKIEPGVSDFCRFTRQNSVALPLSPKRAYLLRAAVMNSARLVSPETRPIDPPESKVHTVNLTTAIMEFGVHTFEDMILVSKSAAARMECEDTTCVVRWSPEPIRRFEVKPGDKAVPFHVLAKDVLAVPMYEDLDGGDLSSRQDESWRTSTIIASELTEEATLDSIEVAPQWYAGRFGFRTAFVFKSLIPLRTGDKITNFAGCKGIVRVFPDNLMPRLPDGRHVNLCVSPLSVAKRACVSMLLEMAIGKAFEKDEWERIKVLGDQAPENFSWACISSARSAKDYLSVMDQVLPEKTYWGVMPWIRILKSGIGYRRCSSVGEERPLTSEGLLPDDAASAGQKLDSSKAIVMVSRGLTKSLKSILATSPGSKSLREFVLALERPAGQNPFRASKPREAEVSV